MIASHWSLQLQKGGQMTDHRDSKEWDILIGNFIVENLVETY